jgi:uncharacterized protein (TIGR03066 family)
MILSYLTRLLCIVVILVGVEHLWSGKAVVAAPAPSSNQKKIVGVWEITKSDDGTPLGTTIEFTKDGKVKVTTPVGDQKLNLDGTYKLEGDKLTVTIKPPDEKETTETVTIIKLTDKVLITKDQKGNSDEFKKKK